MVSIFKFKINTERSIGLLMFLVLIEMISVNLTNSALVLFALDLDASIIDINLIRIVTIILPLILQLPFGVISDRMGRKPLIIIQQLSSLSSALLRSFALNPFHLIVSSVIRGVGGGLFFPQLLSLIGDLTSSQEKASTINKFYIFSSVGMLTGPGLASAFLKWVSLRELFVIECLLRLITLVLVTLLLKERRNPVKDIIVEDVSHDYMKAVRTLLGRRNMLTVIQMAGCFTFFRAVFQTYTPIFARESVGVTDSLIVLFGSFMGITILVSRVFLEKIIIWLDHKKVLMLMLAVCFFTGFSLPFSNSFITLSMEMILMGLCIGVLEPMGSILVAHSTSTRERGFGNSLNHFMKSLGSMASIVLVPIATGTSFSLVFPIAAVLPFISFFITNILMEPVSEKES